MSLTPDSRQKIDDIRNYLFGGGYPDPVSNAEQLAFLFYFYLAETLDTQSAARARVLKQSYQSPYAGEWTLLNPLNAACFGGLAVIPRERFRWSQWAKALSGENLVRFVRDEIFPFFTEIAGNSAMNFMDGARLGIDEPTVLTQVINKVDELRLDSSDSDTKGDLFEHVLRQIKQAGELGQFRTPRHVIRAIVAMINPQIGETIYDPAAGTAGFLAAAYDYIKLNNSSDHAIEMSELDGKQVKRGQGDKLSAPQWLTLQERTFFGNDVDPKMVRLATMNLTLRGLPAVKILKRNALTTTLDNEQKRALELPIDGYHVILANPPFSGRVDKDRIVDEVKIGNTTSTELLFLKYMMDSLRAGGRCGVIVPEGVLFGSTSSHKELRRQLIENNTVEAVMSLPGGVFQPYSGVKTSVLFFKQGGSTDKVLFLHVDNDGYKLDANHDVAIEADDLPSLVHIYHSRENFWVEWLAAQAEVFETEATKPDSLPINERSLQSEVVQQKEWIHNWWFANLATLRANDFSLSVGRYRPMNKTAVQHRSPLELLDELAAIEVEIAEEVEALKLILVGDN